MFRKDELYEYLMEADTELDQIWEGLAAKFYVEADSNDSNKLSDIAEKAKANNIIFPDPEMVSAWRFIKEHVEGKVTSTGEFEKLVNAYGLTTTTSNTGSIDI